MGWRCHTWTCLLAAIAVLSQPATASAEALTVSSAADSAPSLDISGASHTSRHLQSDASSTLDVSIPKSFKIAKSHPYVAICSIFKNEHDHVLEWIKYHQWIGVGKFYIFDHGSHPPMAEVLSPWVEAGVVEIVYFTNSWQLDLRQAPNHWIRGGRDFLSPQAWAYDNCFRWFGHRHRFIALLDVDEFVIMRAASPYRPDLPTFLKAYEKFGGLMVHWQLLGPSGHRTRPEGGTLKSYTQCASRSDMQQWRDFQANPVGFMKSFTNTEFAAGGCNPHKCVVHGKQYVNEDFNHLSGQVARELHWDKIVIFHYVTRSEQEYAKKMTRGSGHSQFSLQAQRLKIKNRGWKYFHQINSSAHSQCLEGTWMHRLCFLEGQQVATHEAQHKNTPTMHP